MLRRLLALSALLVLLAACGDSSATPPVATQPDNQATPPAVTWAAGAVQTFHSDNGNYNGTGGYTDAFTVPALWRLSWFCQGGSDVTQAFFAIDVQHAGDLSPADGETPVAVNCDQQPHGMTEERVGGSVTLQILAGSGTSWDVYVQVPV